MIVRRMVVEEEEEEEGLGRGLQGLGLPLEKLGNRRMSVCVLVCSSWKMCCLFREGGGEGGGEKAEEEPMEQGEGGGAPKEATEGAEGKLPSISLTHTLVLFGLSIEDN